MKLEGVDPQHPSMYFILTVAEVSWRETPNVSTERDGSLVGGGKGGTALPQEAQTSRGVHWNKGKSKSKYWGAEEKAWDTAVTE